MTRGGIRNFNYVGTWLSASNIVETRLVNGKWRRKRMLETETEAEIGDGGGTPKRKKPPNFLLLDGLRKYNCRSSEYNVKIPRSS